MKCCRASERGVCGRCSGHMPVYRTPQIRFLQPLERRPSWRLWFLRNLKVGGGLHSGKQVPHVEESAQKVELVVCLGVEERMGKSHS